MRGRTLHKYDTYYLQGGGLTTVKIGSRRIIVDADACPVKEEIIETARLYSVPVVMVASHDHKLHGGPNVKIVQVDRAYQSADMYIANQLNKEDILITQDIGLATLGLARNIPVLTFRGQIYTAYNIDYLLARRHLQTKRRRSGDRVKGPRAMTIMDKVNFQHTLTKVLNLEQEIGLT